MSIAFPVPRSVEADDAPPQTVAPITETLFSSVAELQSAAYWARSDYEIHYDACRTRMADRFCQRCEDLDVAAFATEREYFEASRANS